MVEASLNMKDEDSLLCEFKVLPRIGETIYITRAGKSKYYTVIDVIYHLVAYEYSADDRVSITLEETKL